jgi:glycosyltransferase involved in cell wall biosynthesis
MRGRDIFISVVLRVRDAENFVTTALDRLVAVMEAGFNYYEILIVDDASVDATREHIAAVQARARNIQVYALARRKGDNIALTAGLDHAIGDMVVLLDPRLDPPELIPEMVERALDGAEIVYGLPRDRLESRGPGNLQLPAAEPQRVELHAGSRRPAPLVDVPAGVVGLSVRDDRV